MKPVFKILKLSAIIIVTILVILISASFLLRDKVTGIMLGSLNSNISTKLEFGSSRLSFLRKFPKASIELKDVLVHSSPDFNSKAFKRNDTDTLLVAKFVSVDFKITDIIKGYYYINRISAKNGKINFFTDSSGHINYDISAKGDESGTEVTTINLERINLSNIKAYYNNLDIKLIIEGRIKTGKIRTRISGDNIDFTTTADININRFQLSNTILTRTIPASLNMILQHSKSGYLFKKGTLAIDNYEIGLTGSISKENDLDLNITGHNIDLSKVKIYLPEKYFNLISDYNPSGIFIADCKIKGPLSATKSPHIEINSHLKNGHVTYGKSKLSVSGLSFDGYLSNGLKNSIETSDVSFKNVRLKLGSSEYTGSLSISGFKHPKSDLTLKGKILPRELREFFDIKNISTAEGSVDADIKLVTDFWPKDTITINNIIDLKTKADLGFNSFSIGYKNDKLLFNNVNGNLSVSDILTKGNLSFLYKGQKIKVNGEFTNLPEWLAGRQVKMVAVADVSFNRLIPEVFLKNNISSVPTGRGKRAVAFPGDILLDVNFRIDTLDYKTFSSTGISGTLNYKPRVFTFKSLSMNSLNGSISGSGFVVQNKSKSVISRGSFKVDEIDVNKAFKTFNNFGQEFIKAANLSGTLSGSLSLLLPLDSLLNPQIKSVTAEGKFTLIDGGLINFEPVEQLSSFIELSELQNIHFDKLENDFFIRNNSLYLPQMEVKSSAADLSVNGRHSFDNDYEYHVKMLLSELLSKKRKKNSRVNTEFGAVQDDGLGRTSILLKVTGKGEEVKVGYDIKAAGKEVIKNIQSERQTLKSILNQEYGWYKNDTSAVKKPAEKKSRFRITWDETDSTKTINKNPPAKKEGTKKLFR